MRAYETMNQSSPFQDGSKRAILLAFSVFCSLLLVYASLVPLKYTPLSWSDSLQRWQDIPWLNLSVANRADGLQNALVVIPSHFCYVVQWTTESLPAVHLWYTHQSLLGHFVPWWWRSNAYRSGFHLVPSRKTISLPLHRSVCWVRALVGFRTHSLRFD